MLDLRLGILSQSSFGCDTLYNGLGKGVSLEQEDSLETTESLREKAIATFNETFISRVRAIDPEISEMNEIELESHMSSKLVPITPKDFFIRKRFWELAEQNVNTGMSDVCTVRIYEGIMTKSHFQRQILRNPYKLAWILLPQSKHQDLIDESFYFTLRKVRNEILTMQVTEKSAPIILKALEFFANRSMGPMLQKIEQRSMNVTVDGNKAMREAINPEEMQAKFAELQAKLVSLPSTAVVVDEPE
jgi:hypothetical protein